MNESAHGRRTLVGCARTAAEGDATEGAAGQDAHAFERVWLECRPAVHAAALGVLKDPARAQDVVQEVFLRLWSRPEAFDSGRGALVTYLCVQARSRATDIWREGQAASRASARLRTLAGAAADDTPVLALALRGDRAAVRRAVARLPAAQREVLIMSYWGGLTAEQIAGLTGTPLGTVKSRIRLGLLRLRALCEPVLSQVA